VSLKEANGDDPYTVTFERAKNLLEEKIDADKKALLKTFDEDPEMRILVGRYGPYLKHGKSNYKLPKDEEPTSFTYQQCLEIMAQQPQKTRRAVPKKSDGASKVKKVTAKKTVTKKKTSTKKKPTTKK
jgi:DNA topoisomerase-1